MNPIGRLCLLLASTGTSTGELQAFLRWVEERGAREALATINSLRETAEIQARTSKGTMSAQEPSSSEADGRARDTARKIEETLLYGARMTKTQAAESLREQIYREFGVRVPPLGKGSFSTWLLKLAQDIDPSSLLHVVSRMRTQHRAKPITDWPLRKAEE